MKTYKELMQEAVSATRLAQLAAKGKGPAAAAKMKADGLTSSASPANGRPTIKRPDKPAARPNKSSPISGTVMPSKPRAVGYGQQPKATRNTPAGTSGGSGGSSATNKALRSAANMGRKAYDAKRMKQNQGVRVEPPKRQPQGYRNPGAGTKDYTDKPGALVKTPKPKEMSSAERKSINDRWADKTKNRSPLDNKSVKNFGKRAAKAVGQGFKDSMKADNPITRSPATKITTLKGGGNQIG